MHVNANQKPKTCALVRSSSALAAGWSLLVVLIVVMNFAALRNMHHHPGSHENSLRAFKLSPKTSNTTSRELPLLPPTIWATRKLSNAGMNDVDISSVMTADEMRNATNLCGKFLYSTLQRALHVKNLGQDVFVATGDIDSMWIRDSVVQMSIYLKHVTSNPWLRFVIEGAIRRNAFNILQDPYANAYERKWKDPKSMEFRDQVIGRGGYVASRNYELDSGAYFMTHLYDYYVAETIRRPEHLLEEPIILDAVMTMIDIWITEQRHDERSPYRYFELPFQGNGPPSGYTGMTWSAFRPSDDPCKYGYLIPANIHAAAGLQRVLILNERIWKNDELATKASKLLEDIEQGINTYGIVQDDHGESMYAYEVDGLGGVLKDFDDANVPSLLSIPLLGWDGYNRKAYENTRNYILSSSNQHYSEGSLFTGLGSPHTPELFIWPMAMVIQGLTEDGPDRVDKMAFQMRQLLKSASNDTMHESVHKDIADLFTREWFEWANALFVVYVETVTGASCSVPASEVHGATTILAHKAKYAMEAPSFYQESKNDPWDPRFYQNVVASIHFDSDVESPQVFKRNFDFSKELTDRVESDSNFPNPLADNVEKNNGRSRGNPRKHWQ